MSGLVACAGFATRELMLFAATGFLIGGLDELAVDLVWISHRLRRARLTHVRADATTIAPAERPGRIAVFVPAWDEGDVIGPMLANTLARFGDGDYRVYVGCYPNDPGTLLPVAEAARDPRIRLVMCAWAGPTTKADCLNHLWQALLEDETRDGVCAKAIVLHDAEDIVHPAEPRIFDRLIERFALVQLPVLPLIDRGSRWIAGHYADAFAEAHGKGLVAREALGASIPAAGVGCAFSRAALGKIAQARGGQPFDAKSLTEDYELGLAIHAMGGRAAFVRLPGVGIEGVVAVREYFPHTIDGAVRQKARWMAGIALDGWDRLGWAGGAGRWAENWMRLRDRRAPLAALLLAAGYAALILWSLHWIAGLEVPPVGSGWDWVFAADGVLLAWRVVARMLAVRAAYGWAEGLRSVPRLMIGNIIDMMAAVRAIRLYLRSRRSGMVRWDKTVHRFPSLAVGE